MSMPSYWYDPIVGGGANIGASQGAALDASMRAQQANQQNQLAQWNTYDPWANTPGGFGAQTAYYQQQAANSYGNINSSTLTPSSVGYSQPAPAPQPQHNVFDYGTTAFNPYGGVGGLQTFDPGKYYQQNPDVLSSGTDAWAHYNQFGKNEGRQGTWADSFNASNYLANNPDVYAAGADPTQHWFQFGAKEGRTGGGGENPFNAQEYLLQNRDVAAAGVDPYQHWLNFGAKEGRDVAFGGTEDADWSNYFSQAGTGSRDAIAAAYLANNRDVFDAAQASGRDPTAFGFEHFQNYGQNEDRGFFDEARYLQQNPDVAASGMDPTAHWFQFGQNEGRTDPTTYFNYGNYLAQNPDVLAAGVDPMEHYLQYGVNEGRGGGYEWGSQNRAPGTASEILLADQRAGFAEQARKDPNLMFKLAAKAVQEDQNSPEGQTAVIEAMLNRMNATGQNPLNPAYYPKDKAAYNAEIEQRLRNNPTLYASVLQNVERAFGGSNIAKYGTNWSSGDTWKNEAKYVTPTQAMGANQFYIKDLNVPDASGKSWAGKGTVDQNKRWFQSVNGVLPY